MKILYLITKSTEGGAQTHISQLAKAMVSQGHEVAVMSAPGGWLETAIQECGGTFLPNVYFKNSYNPLRFFSTSRVIMDAVRMFKPDIVSCHSGFAGFMGRVSIRNRVPTIFTAHGWSFSPGGPLHQRILTLLAEYIAGPFCKKIICVSHYDKELARRLHAAPTRKITVVHNGVEMPEFVPTVRSNLHKLAFVGRLAPQKKPFVFLEAIAAVPDAMRSQLSATIIGDGPFMPHIIDFVSRHNLSSIVSLPGALPRSQVLSSLNDIDLFVLVSGREGLPRSIIEAMSRGVPVIGSAVGGVSELISPEIGYLLPKHHETGLLTEHIEYLYNHPDVLRSMSVNAYQRAKRYFSIESTIQNTFDVYQEVLSA